MVTLTRRRTLWGIAGALAALAGCNNAPVDTPTAGESDSPRYDNVERDPDSVVLRTPKREPAAWLASEGTDADEPTEDRRLNRPDNRLIADRETADRLRYADVSGTEEAEQFVADTDFESETLLLDSSGVGECYELQLCYLTWSRSEYHTWYMRTYRPADVACEADDRGQVLHLIRIPDVLDPEQVRSSGSGVNTNRCWSERRFGRKSTPTTDGADGTATTGGDDT